MISYRPFFETIKRKGISQYSLENEYNISKGTLDSLRQNKNITLSTVENLCDKLNCEPWDIFELIKEK